MDLVLYTLLRICDKSWHSFLMLLPYVLAGVTIGELLKYTSWTALAYRGVSRAPVASVFAASVLGMASPLCTYGTVPVVVQLKKAGVKISPLAAFLATSAMMNPQLFIMTLGGLGWHIAAARGIAVLLFGLLLGLVLSRIPAHWVANPDTAVCDTAREEILQRKGKSFEIGRFAADALKSLQFVGFYIVIGIVLGAMVEVLVPGYWISFLFKPGSWISVLTASLMGVPLYACGGGVIPLVRSFLNEGMSQGAALAFLIVGPATRLTPIMALAAVLRPLFIILYLILLIGFSIIAGIIFR